MIRVRAAGDAAMLLETVPPGTVPLDNGPQAGGTAHDGNGAALLAVAIRGAALPGVIDVVPGAATVLVSFEPGTWAGADLAGRLTAIAADRPADAGAGEPSASPGAVEIDVVYDGPDLADVASLTGLTVAEVVARHQAATYRVGWLGFAPGFGYLTGLDPLLAAVPRLASPRQNVPAGSVAIAGGLAAVYPAASPGGWQLLGRTSAALWVPDRDPPALLAPGMQVRFRGVDVMSPAPAPALVSAPAATGQIEVLQPGPFTTVQDLGRPGLAHLGVPASGAADPGSLRLANELVGNAASAACLEATLGRLALRFHADAVVAVTGAPVPIRLSAAGDGAVSDRVPSGGEIVVGSAFAVAAGSVLRLGAPSTGLRSYVAIDGGISVGPVLGSRSADSLSRLGPRPLRPGDWLPVGRPRSHPNQREGSPPRTAGPGLASGSVPAVSGRAMRGLAGTGPEVSGPVELQVIAGPRDDWFASDALLTLSAGSYAVGAASNRSGLRLNGPALRRSRPGELLSEGMATGSLQVTHDGQPILLLADHPTTGGYPVIGVVVSADLGRAGQLRPGQQVRFRVARGDPL